MHQQMLDNATERLSSINARVDDLKQSIKEKQQQIDEIENAHKVALSACKEAEQAHDEAKARAIRQQVRLDAAKDTDLEQQQKEALLAAQAEIDLAQQNLTRITTVKEEINKRLAIVAIFKDEIADHRQELAEMSRLQCEFEAVCEEAKVGIKEEHHQAWLNAVEEQRQRYRDAVEAQREAEERLRELLGQPDDRARWTATRHILQAYLDFCHVLDEYGQSCEKRIGQHQLIHLIDLNQYRLLDLMRCPGTIDPWRTIQLRNELGVEKRIRLTQQMEVIEQLLRDSSFGWTRSRNW